MMKNRIKFGGIFRVDNCSIINKIKTDIFNIKEWYKLMNGNDFYIIVEDKIEEREDGTIVKYINGKQSHSFIDTDIDQYREVTIHTHLDGPFDEWYETKSKTVREYPMDEIKDSTSETLQSVLVRYNKNENIDEAIITTQYKVIDGSVDNFVSNFTYDYKFIYLPFKLVLVLYSSS